MIENKSEIKYKSEQSLQSEEQEKQHHWKSGFRKLRKRKLGRYHNQLSYNHRFLYWLNVKEKCPKQENSATFEIDNIYLC